MAIRDESGDVSRSVHRQRRDLYFWTVCVDLYEGIPPINRLLDALRQHVPGLVVLGIFNCFNEKRQMGLGIGVLLRSYRIDVHTRRFATNGPAADSRAMPEDASRKRRRINQQ